MDDFESLSESESFWADGHRLQVRRGFSSIGSKEGLENKKDLVLLNQDRGEGGRSLLVELSVRASWPFSRQTGEEEDIIQHQLRHAGLWPAVPLLNTNN